MRRWAWRMAAVSRPPKGLIKKKPFIVKKGGREGERDEGIDSLSKGRPTAMVLLAAGE